MSEMSKVVSDRDRARLQFKEYVIELTAARGQEDDVVDELIVKVNEAFDTLLSSHVELVLSLGESLSDETHENFMYEASDERDEAVEEAEEEKVKAKEIIREKTIAKKSIKVNNLGLVGKKDREEFFDEKLEISRKVSQEVAESDLFCMFSAWVNLRDAHPDASLQGGEIPHEASRALNRANSIKQKLPSIPEEIFDVLYGAPGQVSCAGSCDVTGKPSKEETGGLKLAVKIHREVEATAGDDFHDPGERLVNNDIDIPNSFEFYDPGEKLFGNTPKTPDIAVKIHHEVEAVGTEEFHDPGEKLFDSVLRSKGLTRFNITLNDRDPTRFKLTGSVCVKRRSGSIRLNNKSAMAGQLGKGKLAKYSVWGAKHLTQQESVSFKLEQQFRDLQQARIITKFRSTGSTYVRKLYIDMAQFKGFTRLNIPFNHVDNKLKLERKLVNGIIPSRFIEFCDTGGKLFDHMDNELKLEQKLSSLQQAGDLPEFKLGTACAKRYSGSTVLVVKSEFIKKGVGGCNLFEQYVCAVRNYEDFGPLAKNSRFEVSGGVCLKEKHRAFIREELNILLKHSDNKFKLERQSSNFQQASVIAKLSFKFHLLQVSEIIS